MASHRLGIRARIYGGYSILIVLGLALAGFAIWELSSVARSVGTMSQLAESNTRNLETLELLEKARRADLRYRLSGDVAALREGEAADAAVADLLQQGAAG